MVAALAQTVTAFDGERTRARCFAHTINLVVKSVLQEFEPKRRDGGRIVELEDSDGEDENGLSDGEGEGEGEGDVEGDVEGEAEDEIIGGDMSEWLDERTQRSTVELEGLDIDVQPL